MSSLRLSRETNYETVQKGKILPILILKNY